jgi:hypothetical protein
MRVFISWSGDPARVVAKALGFFIGECIQAAKPWMSDEIPKGEPWSDAILTQLQESHVGIVCVTRENQTSPWLLFEGGALAKNKALHVFLIDAIPTDIGPPFGMYQHTRATQDEVLKLLLTIDAKLPADQRRGEERLKKSTEKNWPELDVAIHQAKGMAPKDNKPRRADRELLEEVLSIVREIASPSTSSLPLTRADAVRLKREIQPHLLTSLASLRSLVEAGRPDLIPEDLRTLAHIDSVLSELQEPEKLKVLKQVLKETLPLLEMSNTEHKGGT